MTKQPGWTVQARAMRKLGYSVERIAEKFGVTKWLVRQACDEDGSRTRRNVRRREGRQAHLSAQDRRPRMLLDREAIPGAALAFAQGLIDRTELMRRITRIEA